MNFKIDLILKIMFAGESVTWIVVDQLFQVSKFDMEKLQKVRDHEGFRIKRNNRPIQPINGRKIYYYDEL